MQFQSGGCGRVPFCGASQPQGREAAQACVRFVCPAVAHRALAPYTSFPSLGGWPCCTQVGTRCRGSSRSCPGPGLPPSTTSSRPWRAPRSLHHAGLLRWGRQTDRGTALCENGFESPGLCHFKLACNGFPWEEGGVLPPVSPRSL